MIPLLPPLPAHGFGDVGDLPVTLPMLLVVAGAAVLGTAARLSARATRSPTRTARAGVALPAGVTTLADHPASRAVLRAAAAVLLGVAGLTAALGADDFLHNPAPALLFAVFWVGVLLLGSLLLGPVWRAANPLRAVSSALSRFSGDPDDRFVRAVPEPVGVWPAAAMLAVFVWMEQVVTRQPLTVLVLLAAYVVVQVGAATIYGRGWYAHGDGFEVYSSVIGWLAPLARDDAGGLVLRSPRRRLAAVAAAPGLLAVLAVLLGGHLYDSLGDTLVWQQLQFGRPRLLVQTAGLAACVAVAAALVGGATTRARFLRPAVVPVVVAYAIAHYFGPFVVEAQHAVITLSDPLATGADLLGLTGRQVVDEAVPPALAAVAQIVAFLGFHVFAVVVAHDRAVARFDTRTARAVQFPLRSLFVLSAVGGVALRFAG